MYEGRDNNPPLPFYSPPKPFNHQIHPLTHPAANAELKWLNTSKAKQRGAAAKAHALSAFKSAFHALTYPDSKYKLTLTQVTMQLS